MPTRGLTLGFDYSSTAAFLAYVSDKVERVQKIPLSTDSKETIQFIDTLRWMLHNDRERLNSTIYVEKAWVNGKHFPLSGLMLARTATIIETCALLEHYDVEFIHPKAWRKVVYGNASPQNPKEKAVNFVLEKYQYTVPTIGKTVRSKAPDHNIAEAICIARYGYERNLMLGEGR